MPFQKCSASSPLVFGYLPDHSAVLCSNMCVQILSWYIFCAICEMVVIRRDRQTWSGSDVHISKFLLNFSNQSKLVISDYLVSSIKQASQRSLSLFRWLNQDHICKITHCQFTKTAHKDLLAYFVAWMTADSSNETAPTSPISSKVITLLVSSFWLVCKVWSEFTHFIYAGQVPRLVCST